jgi:hypothetical protein
MTQPWKILASRAFYILYFIYFFRIKYGESRLGIMEKTFICQLNQLF